MKCQYLPNCQSFIKVKTSKYRKIIVQKDAPESVLKNQFKSPKNAINCYSVRHFITIK